MFCAESTAEQFMISPRKSEFSREQPRPLAAAIAAAFLQCAVVGLLAFSTGFVAWTMSVGFARAQSVHAFSEPDTGLVAALLAFAVVLMGGLSAVAVRWSGRPRQR